MIDIEDTPRIINIMPYYGPVYATDEDGSVIDVSDYFGQHPNIEEVKLIENQLYGLAEWMDYGEPFGYPEDNPNFPWKRLDDEGLFLTRKLAELLGEIGIPIIYHRLNPAVKIEKEVVVYPGKKADH